MKMIPLFAFCAIASITTPVVSAQDKNAPDNSQRNERDRTGQTKTPMDQSNDPADLKLVQTIRQAVVKDGSLSMTAKNVKIITAGGQVTLRGPVNTADEKSAIEAHAKKAAGDTKVDSQIEVKTPAK